jgi:hypothetical protein
MRARLLRQALIRAVRRQKIRRLFDKARLRSPPATQQKYIGAARGFQGEAQPVRLVFRLDQGAARVIGDNAKALPRRSRDPDVADESFDLGRHKRCQRSGQDLGQFAARRDRGLILAKDDGGQHRGVS